MRGSILGKHEKTRKSRENTSRKVFIWNTFEQYVGLKLVAAYPFSEIPSQKSQKSRNRHFLAFEQYAGLKVQEASFLHGSGGQE